MVNFEVIEDKMIFTYSYSDYINTDWVRNGLREDGYIYYKSAFHFTKEDLYNEEILEAKKFDPTTMSILDVDNKPISFVFAEKLGDYFKVKKGVLSDNRDIYFYKDIDLVLEYFIAETKISLFKQILSLTNEDVYIGGTNANSIPLESFEELIKRFPTTYEKNLYAEARITSIIKNYFDTTIDSEKKFQNYLNKKKSKKGDDLTKIFQEYEIKKYSTILDKLEEMLSSENSYSENQ